MAGTAFVVCWSSRDDAGAVMSETLFTTIEAAAQVIYEGIVTNDDVPGVVATEPFATSWTNLTDEERAFWIRLLRDAVLPDQLDDVAIDEAMSTEANGADRIVLMPSTVEA